MAEDLWAAVADTRMSEERREEIVKEALRQSESCLWTSTVLFIWLRRVRKQRMFYVAAPVVLGAFAGFTVLQDLMPAWVIACASLLASLFPALADALKIETSVDETAKLAAEFKALQDRFRRLANEQSLLGDVNQAAAILSDLMDRMDLARSSSITPPEWCFHKAREKIEGGHYSFGADAA